MTEPQDVRRIQQQAAHQFVSGRDDAKLPTIVPERIAYHPTLQERYGIDRASWRALIDAVWPSAKTTEGVLLALSYCRARNLDPFKRPVHIVPIYSTALGKMVESVWPGIGELRTTAHRTAQYAGKGRPEWGPIIESVFFNKENKELKLKHPEWCEVTVSKLVGGKAREFVGDRVWWLETYAREDRNSEWPNAMWRKRVNGQLAKCAEAAALRSAFPEELGNEMISDEIGPDMRDITPVQAEPEPEPQARPSALSVVARHNPPPAAAAVAEVARQAESTQRSREPIPETTPGRPVPPQDVGYSGYSESTTHTISTRPMPLGTNQQASAAAEPTSEPARRHRRSTETITQDMIDRIYAATDAGQIEDQLRLSEYGRRTLEEKGRIDEAAELRRQELEQDRPPEPAGEARSQEPAAWVTEDGEVVEMPEPAPTPAPATYYLTDTRGDVRLKNLTAADFLEQLRHRISISANPGEAKAWKMRNQTALEHLIQTETDNALAEQAVSLRP